MPFSSKAQMRKFFSLESQGKLKKGTSERWAKETKNIKSLPMRIKDKKSVKSKTSKYKMQNGGGVGDEKKKKPEPKKTYPITDSNVKKPNLFEGKGELKQVDDKSGIKKYHKNPETGKVEEYKAERYEDVKGSKKPVPKPVPQRGTPMFSSSTFLKKGGVVGGKGTGTSDSNPAKIKKGSFIIPAKIRSKLLDRLRSGHKADLNQKGGKEVMLSKGEEVVEPKGAEELDTDLKKSGVKSGINVLAPKSRKKFSRKNFLKKK